MLLTLLRLIPTFLRLTDSLLQFSYRSCFVSYRDFGVLIDLAYFLLRFQYSIDLVVYLTEHLGKIIQSLQTGN